MTRAHQSAIWERTCQVLRLRSTLCQYFPAAVQAFGDLIAKDSLLLWERAPSSTIAAKLTRGQLVCALRTASLSSFLCKNQVLSQQFNAITSLSFRGST